MTGIPAMPHPKRLVDPRDGLVTSNWRQWLEAVRRRLFDQITISAPVTPVEIAAGGTWPATVSGTGTGIKPGQAAKAFYSEPLAGVVLIATVADEDEVTVVFWNVGGAPVTPAPGTVTARVEV